MPKTILIDPVTRIEGHAKISIHLDENGAVNQARFHITDFRGFEEFCKGRPMWEMPGITARICGICPVSHLLASAKTGDALLAVTVSPTADKLRRMMNLGQIIQSHALSFFHLSAPDFVFGMDSDPTQRNIFGIMAANPELARNGIRLRKFGQDVIERLGGRKIHAAWTVPGGVREPLSEEHHATMRAEIDEMLALALDAIGRFKAIMESYREEAEHFGNFSDLFMGLVGEDGAWEYYEGSIRFCDSEGQIVADGLDAGRFYEFIGEAVEPWTYLKFPYLRERGYPDGCYRVGPLARLNICSHFQVPRANQELRSFRDYGKGAVKSSFYFHYARLIEILASIEYIDQLLNDADILGKDVRAEAGINKLEGVGYSEAPRGTLFHRYWVDRNGLIQNVNLLIATGQNNMAMNRAVTQVAKQYVKGEQISEGMLNRVEASIRAFDPCLSCSTHAVGQMPLQITLYAADGRQLDQVVR